MTNQRKIEAILAYFANYTDTKYLGKVKLMKLFYNLDFTHTREYGIPVTYDTYYNLEHGPIPTTIKDWADTFESKSTGQVFEGTVSCEHPKGTKMCRFLPARGFTDDDAKLFSETELKVLEQVASQFKRTTTEDIEAASHSEAPWSETKLNEQIPYYLAAHDKRAKVSEDEIKLALSIL